MDDDIDNAEVSYSIHPPQFVILTDEDDRPPSPLESEPDTPRQVLDDHTWDTERRHFELSSIDGSGGDLKPIAHRPAPRKIMLPPSFSKKKDDPFDESPRDVSKDRDVLSVNKDVPRKTEASKSSVVRDNPEPTVTTRRLSQISSGSLLRSRENESPETEHQHAKAVLPRKENVAAGSLKLSTQSRSSKVTERNGSTRLLPQNSSGNSHSRRQSRDTMPDDEKQYSSAPILSVPLSHNAHSSSDASEGSNVANPPPSSRKKQLFNSAARVIADSVPDDEQLSQPPLSSKEKQDVSKNAQDQVYEVDSEITEIRKGIEELEALLAAARVADAKNALPNKPLMNGKKERDYSSVTATIPDKVQSGVSQKHKQSQRTHLPRDVHDESTTAAMEGNKQRSRYPSDHQKRRVTSFDSEEPHSESSFKLEDSSNQESSSSLYLYRKGSNKAQDMTDTTGSGTRSGDQSGNSAFSLFPAQAVSSARGLNNGSASQGELSPGGAILSEEQEPTMTAGSSTEGEQNNFSSVHPDTTYVPDTTYFSEVASSTLAAAADAAGETGFFSEAAALTLLTAGEAVENLLFGEAEKNTPPPPTTTNYASDSSRVSTDTDSTNVTGNLTSKKERAKVTLGEIKEDSEQSDVSEDARSGHSNRFVPDNSEVSKSRSFGNEDGNDDSSASTPPPPPFGPLTVPTRSAGNSSKSALENLSTVHSKSGKFAAVGAADGVKKVERRDDSSSDSVAPSATQLGKYDVHGDAPSSSLPQIRKKQDTMSRESTKNRYERNRNTVGQQLASASPTKQQIGASSKSQPPASLTATPLSAAPHGSVTAAKTLASGRIQKSKLKSGSTLNIASVQQPRSGRGEERQTITPVGISTRLITQHGPAVVLNQSQTYARSHQAFTPESITLSNKATVHEMPSDERRSTRLNPPRPMVSRKDADNKSTRLDVIMDPTLLDADERSETSHSEQGLLDDASFSSMPHRNNEFKSEIRKPPTSPQYREKTMAPQQFSPQSDMSVEMLSHGSGSFELDSSLDGEGLFLDLDADGEPYIPNPYLSFEGRRSGASVGSSSSCSVTDEHGELAMVVSLNGSNGIARGDITLSLLDESSAQTSSDMKGSDKVRSAISRMRDMRKGIRGSVVGNGFEKSTDSFAPRSSSKSKRSHPIDVDKERVAGGEGHIEFLQDAALKHLEVSF